MTERKRRALPGSAFGLPERRAYPMPDPAHAKAAKARASQQYNRGALSKSERKRIFDRAERVITRCER